MNNGTNMEQVQSNELILLDQGFLVTHVIYIFANFCRIRKENVFNHDRSFF